MFTRGLLPPIHDKATSFWDDASYADINSWSPFDNYQNFKYLLGKMFKNAQKIFWILASSSYFAVSVLFGIVLFIFQKKWKFLDHPILPILIFFGLIIGGYCAVVIERRYLWLILVLCVLMASFLVQEIITNFNFNRIVKTLLVLVIPLSFLLPSIRFVENRYFNDYNSYEVSQQLKYNGLNGNIATHGNNWHEVLIMSYFNDWKFYGSVLSLEEDKLSKELHQFDIDYFLVRNVYPDKEIQIEGYKEIKIENSEKYSVFAKQEKINSSIH